MSDSDTLAAHLERTGALRTSRLVAAFRIIDRADFVRSEHRATAEADHPLPIGHGQTISQPTTVAMMLEWLAPAPGERILDVGAGSGWTTALLGQVVGQSGEVIGTEIVPELVKFGQANVARYRLPWCRIELAGSTIGFPDAAPFDKILASAAATELPRPLVDQLKVGGTLVIPVGSAVLEVIKQSDREDVTRHEGFAFVPLIT